MKQIISFKNEDEYLRAMDVLGKQGYTFSNNFSTKSFFANALYSDGIFLLLDESSRKISYYNNFYKMPRFAAEDMMDNSISVNDLIVAA